ncbi:hypothetical protein [Brasilonema bromeliae]|nr:hypothetical protein [Brasilonema bromeliae]
MSTTTTKLRRLPTAELRLTRLASNIEINEVVLEITTKILVG